MRAVLGLVGAARARILSAEIFVRAVAPPAPDVAVPTVVRSHLLSQKEFQTTLNWRLTAAQSCLSQSGAAGAHDEQGRIPHPLPDQLIRPDGTPARLVRPRQARHQTYTLPKPLSIAFSMEP